MNHTSISEVCCLERCGIWCDLIHFVTKKLLSPCCFVVCVERHKMNQCICIGTGSYVEVSHGPLISNPTASIKQRIHSKAVGTVVKTAGSHKWDVVFDFGAVRLQHSKSL